MKKIVAFVGSARKMGYCAQVVEQIKAEAESQRAQVVVHTISDMNLKPCQGCMYCRQGKGCAIQDDDMGEVYAQLKEADGVIFAAPIYFGQMSGQAMTLINRLYPLVGPDKTPAFGVKKAIIIYAYAAPGDATYLPYAQESAPIFQSLGFDVRKTILCSNTARKTEEERSELLKRAREAAGLLL